MANGDTRLAEFLRARRARLDPADLGLPVNGRRRTPGLRREEVAALAGLSVEYLTRLEQGRSSRPSGEVLDALARALRLDAAAHRHLRLLAGVAPPPTVEVDDRRSGLVAAVEALAPAAAYLVSPRLDVVAATPAGRALLGPLGEEPAANFARWYFLDPRSRDLHPDWATDAANCTAALRAACRPGGEDPAIDDLVAELAAASPEFRRCWDGYAVQPCTSGLKRLRHPVVGELTTAFEAFAAADGAGTLVTLRAAGDERSRTAFDLVTTIALDFA